MSAELARRSLQPTRVLSDGSSLPTSFGEARHLHMRQRDDAALTPDIEAIHKVHHRKAAGNGTSHARSFDAHPASRSQIREEVQENARRLESASAAQQSEFDGKAGIVKTEDGALRTERSLLGQAAKQVQHDAASTLDNAKSAIRDILESKRK